MGSWGHSRLLIIGVESLVRDIAFKLALGHVRMFERELIGADHGDVDEAFAAQRVLRHHSQHVHKAGRPRRQERDRLAHLFARIERHRERRHARIQITAREAFIIQTRERRIINIRDDFNRARLSVTELQLDGDSTASMIFY